MEFTKNKLLSIVEEVSHLDVDEMARRQKGNRERSSTDLPPKFTAGWKENNPTKPGEEGTPDYWIVNPSQVEGQDILFVPTTCEETEQFINENKEWLDSLGVLHNIVESPQVIYCKKGLPITHRKAETIFASGYKPSGEKIDVGERIKRYSNRKYGQGFYDIIEAAFEKGDFADYLRYSSVPPIVNDKYHRDNYSDKKINNDELTFRMISFDKYESLKDFLKNVIEKIKPIANFRIPENNKPTYDSGDYLARLFNRVYRNWDPERKTDKKFYGYTDKYELKKIGYEENEIDVMSSTFFEISGKRQDFGIFMWTITIMTKFGKKLKEDKRIGRLTEDKHISVRKDVRIEGNSDFNDTYTIMDNFSIKQGLFEAIQEFKEKVKSEITPQDALRLGRMVYKDDQADLGNQLNEHEINSIVKNVISTIKK